MKTIRYWILVLTIFIFLAFLPTILSGSGTNSAAESVEESSMSDLIHNWFHKFHYEKNVTQDDPTAYLNQIPISTDVQGNIYNAIGYQKNTYLSSSGQEEPMDGYYATGYIPAKIHDTVYLYNLDFASGNPYNRIQFYDENKALLGSISTIAQNVLSFSYNEVGSLSTFTIENWFLTDLSNTAYIRLCSTYMNEHTIITVNEKVRDQNTSPITEKIAAFTEKVERNQSDGSFAFAFLTDAHTGAYKDIYHVSIIRAAQVVSELDCLDLVVHGGDITNGSSESKISDVYEEVKTYHSIMENYISAPALWLIGNHDDAPYQAISNRLTQEQTYLLFGSKNSAAGAVFEQNCNYGYVDFSDKKIRVIYLDTHDKRSWGTVRTETGSPDFLNVCNISGEQLQWIADKALNFTDKENPGDWGIIVVSHAELDSKSGNYTDPVTGNIYRYNTSNILQILRAYQGGWSGSIYHNGVTVQYNFSGSSEHARIYCAVNGHGHKFSERNTNGILIIGCPNISNGRERKSDNGVTYTKTIEGTSFCVITIDPETGTIYADTYGSGYDRVF